VDGLKAWLLAVTERQEGAGKAERPVEIRSKFPKGDRANERLTRRWTLTSYRSAHTWKLLTPLIHMFQLLWVARGRSTNKAWKGSEMCDWII
jgi:hypothetical protein